MENKDELKLTPAEKAEKKFLASTFKNQLTEDGLKELEQRFPSDLLIDMTVEANFKQARRDRTECNNLVKDINRRRIDFSTDLKEHGDNLINKVTNIFDVVTIPFEKEDKRRKDIEKAKKEKHEKMLNDQRVQLNDIRGFIDTAKESDLDDISSLIDGLSNIDVEDFHTDLAHEVSRTLKDVNKELTDIFMQKSKEKTLREEAEKAEAEKLQAEESARKIAEAAAEAEEAAEAKRVIQERITKLNMMSIELTGKSSSVIEKKLNALKSFVVPADEFGDRTDEAKESQKNVISTLTTMLDQAKQLEEFQAFQAAQETKKEIKAQPEPQLEKVEECTEPKCTEPKQKSSSMSCDEALNQMKPASQINTEQQVLEVEDKPETGNPSSQFALDLHAWYERNSILEGAYNDLVAVLIHHGINTQ